MARLTSSKKSAGKGRKQRKTYSLEKIIGAKSPKKNTLIGYSNIRKFMAISASLKNSISVTQLMYEEETRSTHRLERSAKRLRSELSID
ncbi:hypothetical protein [Spirosoma pomorum]